MATPVQPDARFFGIIPQPFVMRRVNGFEELGIDASLKRRSRNRSKYVTYLSVVIVHDLLTNQMPRERPEFIKVAERVVIARNPGLTSGNKTIRAAPCRPIRRRSI